MFGGLDAITQRAEQPNRLRILLTSRIRALFAPLLSITIFSGMPLAAKAFAKNLVAAAVLRRAYSMKSKCFRACPLHGRDTDICPSHARKSHPYATNGSVYVWPIVLSTRLAVNI